MSNETALRKYASSKMMGHVVQIESHATAVGVPDTNYCISGVEGWVEMKYTRDTDKIKVRPAQWLWFRKRLQAGNNRIFFLLRWEYGALINHYLIRVRDLAVLERLQADLTPQAWAIHASGSWAKSIDTDEFNDILRGTQRWQ